MKYNIKISIIVPVYNVEHYLEDCLESILKQSYTDYEVICINDASTDDSALILDKYIKKDERIKVFNNKVNKGLSYNRNKGISEANGKYIMFVDSDDKIKEGALESLVELAGRMDFPEIIYYDMEIWNEGSWAKEQTEKKKNVLNYDGRIFEGKEIYEKFNKDTEVIIEAWRQLIKREFLIEKKIAFYEGIYHEDVLFSFYCAMNASKVVYYPKELYIYRRRDNSITSSMNFKRVESYFIVFIELWNYWKNGEWTEGVNDLFENYLEDLYKQFVKSIKYFPNRKLQDFGNHADCFMYKILENGLNLPLEHVTFDVNHILEMRKASQVFVYGAGKIGGEVIQFLQKQKIETSKVLVSNKETNADMLLGVPIVQIDNIDFDKNALIIVGILKSNERAIEAVINNLRYKNINKIMMYDGEYLRIT